jgi:hypothetical protein
MHRILIFFILLNMGFLQAQNDWNQVLKAVASDRESGDELGTSVAISGDYAIVGATGENGDLTGAAYIFVNDNGTWTEMQKLVANDREADDRFGYSVGISGNYAIVGAYCDDDDASGGNPLEWAGSAYIFANDGGIWSQVQKIVPSDRTEGDNFGASVGISGDYAIVGKLYEDEDATGGNPLTQAGAAYIFTNNGGTWTEVQKIVPSDREEWDYFGNHVAISGDYAIVGAYGEDEDAAGGNTISHAGSAYIFRNENGTWTEMQKIVASDRGAADYFGASVAISGDHVIVGAYFEDEDADGGNTASAAG